MTPLRPSCVHHPHTLLWLVLVLAYFSMLAYAQRTSLVSQASSVDGPDPPITANVLVIPQFDPHGSPSQLESKVDTASRFVFERGALPQLAPRAFNKQDKYAYYAELSAHFGMRPGGITVIAFRGLAPDGTRHPSSDNASDYDDTFVILKPGGKKVWELLGSTHAGQSRSSLSPGGVAQIQPGLYQADPCGDFADMPSWLVSTRSGDERIPCWRDYDADGSIGLWEKELPSKATEILFHNGRYTDYGSSIGCQVLPPQVMQRFIAAIGETNSFDYLLLDANVPL